MLNILHKKENMMKSYKTWLTIFLVLILTILVSCGGDNGSSPTAPLGFINVAGNWSFSGQMTLNTCRFAWPASATMLISVAQDGQNLRGQITGGNIINQGSMAGTVTGNSFELVATRPQTQTIDGCTVSFGGGLNVNNIRNNSGTGSINSTVDPVGGDCSGFQLPCSVVHTGTWTRTSQ